MMMILTVQHIAKLIISDLCTLRYNYVGNGAQYDQIYCSLKYCPLHDAER